MKHIYILLFVFSISNAFGQDIILTTENELIRAKIIKITNDIVQYNRYDNLEGPVYEMPISLLQKIDFENGTVETFTSKYNYKEISLEALKELIVENINKYAYNRSGDYNYIAEFEENNLKLILQNIKTKELRGYDIYDFTKECTFHDISKRNEGISYINVIVNKYKNKDNFKNIIKGDTTKRFSKYVKNEAKSIKLVILVKGHDKAEIIYNALKEFNDFFK